MTKNAFILRISPSGIDRVSDALDKNQIIIGWALAEGLLDPALEWDAFREIIRAEYYAEEENLRSAGSAAGHMWPLIRAIRKSDAAGPDRATAEGRTDRLDRPGAVCASRFRLSDGRPAHRRGRDAVAALRTGTGLAVRDPERSGRIESPLLEYPERLVPGSPIYVKADHALPITATVKARSGVFALLRDRGNRRAKRAARRRRVVWALTAARARRVFATHTIVVASTGNLGFSVGLVATAFGLKAEVHMSDCAKTWKKERLRSLGATVVEYPEDYTSTVAAARASADERHNAWLIDDEDSWDMFLGYSGAGRELAAQFDRTGVHVSSERPLVAYLPCGVGGAPGGITYGLRTIYGANVICVFVEPIEAACMLVALASRESEPPSVYDVGLSSRTEADGLAVSRASALVLERVGGEIDAAVAVPDRDLLGWVRRAWAEAELRLEPSASAGFAALAPFLEEVSARPPGSDMRPAWRNIGNAVHLVWTTGGNLMPEEIFEQML